MGFAGPPPIVLAPGVSGGSSHGMLAARAKSSPIGGPAAVNQLQQENMTALQNTPQQAENLQLDATREAVTAKAAPPSVAQTVTALSDAEIVTPKPVPPAQLSAIPDLGAASANIAGLNKVQKMKISLPTGLRVLSLATSPGRTIALDAAGALFLSEDGGKRWQPVPSQWTGRACLLRTRPAGLPSGALKVEQSTQFELVSDNLQTWVSFDGRTWIPQPLPLK